MSVIIKGMQMPKSCAECRWSALTASATNIYRPSDVFPKLEEQPKDYEIHTTHSCMMAYKTIDEETVLSKRADFCPLVEVPKHGRLIDADKAAEVMMFEMCGTGYQSRAMSIIQSDIYTPTVIKAED